MEFLFYKHMESLLLRRIIYLLLKLKLGIEPTIQNSTPAKT